MTPAPQPAVRKSGVTRDRVIKLAKRRNSELAAENAAKASASSDESAKRLANAERASGRARAGG